MALRQPTSLPEIQAVRWRELRPYFMQSWAQGEHAAVIGPSGVGKSELTYDLLNGRVESSPKAHMVIFANKRRDATLQKLIRAGWPRISDWPPHYEHRQRRKVIVWPPYGKASTAGAANRSRFVDALDEIIEEGSWFVALDDAIYYVETLKMRAILDEYWNAARSSRVTVIGAAQSASWIPKTMTTNQSWLFAFKNRDQEINKRVAEVAGDRKYYSEVIDRLGFHEFLVVQTTTGEAYVSNVRT